jgi:predicted lipid-binding transport protein (Tim44 family)
VKTATAWGLVIVLAAAAAPFGWARGGGGCFVPGTPVLRADRTPVAIEHVRPGDALLAFTPEGGVVRTTVRNVLIHDVDEHVVIETERLTVRATPEHPVYVGDGSFRPVAELRAGDCVYALDGDGLRPLRIIHLKRVHGPVRVYNLQTDAPHTFFAGGVAVHNKGGRGGGGGKAGAGGKGGRVPRESKEGHRPYNPKNEPLSEEDAEENPDDGTDDEDEGGWPVWFWPALVGAGLIGIGFLARSLYRRHLAVKHAVAVPAAMAARPAVPVPAVITNGMGAEVAAGVQRHIAATVLPDRVVGVEPGSLPRPEAVLLRSQQTQSLLEALAGRDPVMDAAGLSTVARSLFTLLQYYWQEYDFAALKALVTADLYAKHRALLEQKARNGESYRIDHLRVQAVDIIQVRYAPQLGECTFTAFITATARNYHVAPRPAGASGEAPRLHGDRGPVGFQEFWTFERQGNAWLLCGLEPGWKPEPLEMEDAVELPAPGPVPAADGVAALPKDRNGAAPDPTEPVAMAPPAETVGQESATGVVRVPEQAAAEQVPPAPRQPPATRSERLLDELIQIWDPARLKERVEQVFLDVLRAREAGDLTGVKDEELFPTVAAAVLEVMEQDRQAGVTTEYRHLGVRGVEVIAVRHVADAADGLFTARIRAQAQAIVRRNGEVMMEDPEVSPFEQFWMFGRLDGQWRLKGVLTPDQGRQLLTQEEASADGQGQAEGPEHQAWGPRGEPGSANGGAEHAERVASSAAE